MSKKMSKEEFKACKEGKEDVKEQVQYTPVDMPIRDFLMNRANELIKVPITGPDGVIEIEIHARLSKKEIKKHAKFLEIFTNPEDVDEELAEEVASKFLATICTDSELNEEFWNSDNIDPYVAQELIIAFMGKAAETLEGVRKFRSE